MFRRAAQKLTPDGKLVIEALMPQPSSYDRGRKVTLADANDERVIINVSETDALAQTIHTDRSRLGRHPDPPCSCPLQLAE